MDVEEDDEVAYLQCLLRTDILGAASSAGVYLELEVLANSDNFSLAVVDIDDGGCSSLTFSPDTGAVISEKKTCDQPRQVRGTYTQPLSSVSPEHRFHGSVGLFVQSGRLAFFRRQRKLGGDDKAGEEEEDSPWECTDFVSDLAWAEGHRITPCVAFRSAGLYEVRTARLSSEPPIWPKDLPKSGGGQEWFPIDWDADEQENGDSNNGTGSA